MDSNKTQQRIEELHSADHKRRRKAARWLGNRGTPEAMTYLLAALKDKNWSVRLNAAVALGKIGDEKAVEPLIESLSDTSISVKRAAIHALGNLRDERATEGLVQSCGNASLSDDALKTLLQIGAPALLICCNRMQNESVEVPSLWGETARQMILQGAERLLVEVIRAEDWNGQQRWLILETVRNVQRTLSLLELWRLTKFSRITNMPVSQNTDIALWCDRIIRDTELSALHSGSRQVLDYIMLGRASQRDHAMESEELLRAATGTMSHDTGQTLLRASDMSAEVSEAPALMDRLRRWFAARSRKMLP